MEIALPQDALQFLGFQGKIGDTISLPLSKSLRHGVAMDSCDYEADFVLTGITESNYLTESFGGLWEKELRLRFCLPNICITAWISVWRIQRIFRLL